MHVCLVATEFLGLGAAGGFGFATRSLGRHLVVRGHRVTVLIPRPRGVDETATDLEGMALRTYPRSQVMKADGVFREIGADVYHSQEPSLGSYVAQRAVPHAQHVVTSRDPRDARDWWIELRHPTWTRLGVLRTAAFYENPLTRRAVRRAGRVLVPARFLAPKVQRKYGLADPPRFMPTPIDMPRRRVRKSERPTLCFVGRLDRRKRPERFLSLASRFPAARFIVVGGSQNRRYEGDLQRYAGAENVQLTGFVDQFSSGALSDVYAASWIMVNTAAREGLPNVFIEAAAHGCAIVSSHDPDGFTSRFGWHCPDGEFAAAIRALLHDDLWRARGAAGAAYARATNDAQRATDLHLECYEELLGAHGAASPPR